MAAISWNPLWWILRRTYGFDFFISYARGDARDYAEAIHADLSDAGFRCFLDTEELQAGEQLSGALARTLHRSQVLVVLHSPGANESSWVAQEVELFAPTGRRVVAIDLGGARDSLPGEPGLDRSALQAALGDRIHVPESNFRDPSEETLRQVRRSFEGVRIERRRQAFFGAVAVIMAIVAALAVWFGFREQAAREQAQREAVAARRQMSTRLATEAIDRRSTSPRDSLVLALRAMHTYRDAGDPFVPRAYQALLGSMAAFGCSEPIVIAANDHVAPNLVDVIRIEDDGRLSAGTVRGGSWVPLQLPEPLAQAKAKAHRKPSVVMADRSNTFAAAWTVDDPGRGDMGVVAIWRRRGPGNWQLSGMQQALTGVLGVPKIGISPDGRIVVWHYDGRRVFLAAVENPSSLITLEVQRGLGGEPIVAFSGGSADVAPNLKPWPTNAVAIAADRRLYPFVVESAADGLPFIRALEGRESGVRQPAALALSVDGGRLVVLDRDGTSVLHSFGDQAVSTALPHLFDAFREWLEIGFVSQNAMDVNLTFRPEGDAVLATIVVKDQRPTSSFFDGEGKRDDRLFGIAAISFLEPDKPWIPLLHRNDARFGERQSRYSSEMSYKIHEASMLGVAKAQWIALGHGIASLGLDGTVRVFKLEGGSRGLATNAHSMASKGGRYLIVGGRDGRVLLFDLEEPDDPPRVVHAIGSPIEMIRMDPNDLMERWVLFGGATGHRLLMRDNPCLHPDGAEEITPDLEWMVHEDESRELRIWNALRPVKPVSTPGLHALREIAFSQDFLSAVTWHGHWRTGTLRAWSLVGPNPWDRPVGEWEASQGTDPDQKYGPMPSLSISMREGRPWAVVRRVGPEKTTVWIDLQNPAAAPIQADFESSKTTTDSGGSPARWQLEGDWRDRKLVDTHDPQRRSYPMEWGTEVFLQPGRRPLWADREGLLWTVGLDGEPKQFEKLPPITAIAWSRDTDRLLLGGENGVVWVIEPPFEAVLEFAAEFEKHVIRLPEPQNNHFPGKIDHIDMAPASHWIAATTRDEELLVWPPDGETGWLEPAFLRPGDHGMAEIGEVSFDPTGRRMLLSDARVLPLDPSELEELAEALSPGVLAAARSPDKNFANTLK